MARTVLIIDDEENMRWVLERALKKAGYQVLTARRGEEGLELFALHPVDLVLVDLKMPGMDGLAVLRELRQRDPEVPILLFTAYATVPTAVEALQWGATDYLRKPFDLEVVLAKIHEAIAKSADRQAQRRPEPPPATDFRDFIGAAPALQEALTHARSVAATDYTVHLVGEPGTGRRLLARLIHANHLPPRGRLVELDMAALPPTLLERELMTSGRENGETTGRWQQALGGSLLLADIQRVPEDLAPRLVAHLARYLRTAQRPHGLRLLLTSDGAPHAAWHPVLDQAVTIALPPLRERLEDIPLLLAHFTPEATWTRAAQERLRAYPWPGNVAEFRRVVRQAAASAQAQGTHMVDCAYLPGHLQPDDASAASGPFILPPEGIDLEAVEQDLLRQALARAQGNKSRAARLLGLSRATFLYRLDKYGIQTDES